MPKRIPIKAMRDFCERQGLDQGVLFAYDGERSHVVTWGASVEKCENAAHVGNTLKDLLGWPDKTKADPSRVKRLKERIAELETQLKVQDMQIDKLRGRH